jgi:Arc/MetJ-type ribon-helix-helix transcriptional regulator
MERKPSQTSDSEKITINLGFVDLGQIDLLVREGFYSNRSDFIRTAIRTQLDRHTDAVKHSVARLQLDLVFRHFTNA